MSGQAGKHDLWQVAGASVRGASHIQHGRPNQDAAQWFIGDEQRSFCVAVADGHGAAVYAGSERGSQFAVSIAIEELRLLSEAAEASASSVAAGLPERILARWWRTVDEDLSRNPLSNRELAMLGASGVDARTVYGSTLLAACVTQDFGFAAQLGDGTTIWSWRRQRFNDLGPA